MKEIKLGRTLLKHRHRRGVTQEELAAYLGVSKAAVSKWETEMSYPDITMLPRLAAYFDISIDDLIGYEPQMDKEEIRSCYQRLAGEFAALPFEEAAAHCRELAKNYYSCYPLLFQLGSLLVNHFMLAGTAEKSQEILEEARGLFVRVKHEAEDPGLGKMALQMEAYCLLLLRRPGETLDLIGEEPLELGPTEPLLASAYRMTGSLPEAKRTLQVGIYKQLVAFCNLMSAYMRLSTDEPERFAQICARFQAAADAFSLESLHPGTLLSCYLAAAEGWTALGDTGRALDYLENYTKLAAGNIYPLRLHGDSFFDRLDGWLEELDLGNYPPRDEAVVRRSMVQAVTDNPAFAGLSEHPSFQRLTEKLLRSMEETVHGTHR